MARRDPVFPGKRRARIVIAAGHDATANDDEENLVPLINLVFLLIVFFLLAGTIDQRDTIPVSPPRSISDEPVPDRRLVVSALADGMVYLNGRPVARGELTGALVREAATHAAPGIDSAMYNPGGSPDRRVVHLRADASLSLGQLRSLLVLIEDAGVSETRLQTRVP